MLKMVSEMRKSSAGNLSIGDMLGKLSNFEDSREFKFSNGKYLDEDYGSYRGYYEDFYIEYSDEDKGLNTIGKLKEILNKGLDEGEMQGYKGGDFLITPDTLVWLASYGCCGDMIVDILDVSGQVFIIVKEED